MISNKVLITIILIFFKSYNADELFQAYQKCVFDLEIIGFDQTNTFRNLVLLRSFAMMRDPPIEICDDSVNNDGYDKKLYTDTASLANESESLLNHTSQNPNEEITNEINKDKSNEKNEKSAPLPGDLPGDRQLFLNYALEKLNENIKKENNKKKEEAMNKDPTLCDDSVNNDGSYTDTASLPVYINEYCDVLIDLKCYVNFRTPFEFCENLNQQRKDETNFFAKIGNCIKAPFDVLGCKNDIIEKYYDEFNVYKNFIITMSIMDPDIKEYTLKDLNEFALQYFERQKSIIDSERNSTNDYYINGAGKWCFRKFMKINTSDTSDMSDKSDTISTSGTSDTSGTSGTIVAEIN